MLKTSLIDDHCQTREQQQRPLSVHLYPVCEADWGRRGRSTDRN